MMRKEVCRVEFGILSFFFFFSFLVSYLQFKKVLIGMYTLMDTWIKRLTQITYTGDTFVFVRLEV